MNTTLLFKRLKIVKPLLYLSSEERVVAKNERFQELGTDSAMILPGYRSLMARHAKFISHRSKVINVMTLARRGYSQRLLSEHDLRP